MEFGFLGISYSLDTPRHDSAVRVLSVQRVTDPDRSRYGTLCNIIRTPLRMRCHLVALKGRTHTRHTHTPDTTHIHVNSHTLSSDTHNAVTCFCFVSLFLFTLIVLSAVLPHGLSLSKVAEGDGDGLTRERAGRACGQGGEAALRSFFASQNTPSTHSVHRVS